MPQATRVEHLAGAWRHKRAAQRDPSAIFDEAPSTTYSFRLLNVATGRLVRGSVICGRECHKLTFVPDHTLQAHTKYKAIARLGNRQGVAKVKWTFTTGP